MMKIGIDAQMLCRSTTGIERYAFEMLHELIRLEPEYQFFLYAPRPISGDFANNRNVTVRTVGMRFRGAGTVCNQTWQPYWASLDRVDVFWGPAQRLPLFLSKKIARVVTIHDLVWKRAADTMRSMNRVAEKVFMPQAIRMSDLVVTVSRSTAHDVRTEFPEAAERIRMVYPGTSSLPAPGDTGLLRKYGIEGLYVLFVGTLEPRKNLRRLLQAYALLDAHIRSRYALVIAGGKGWGNQDLAALVRSLGLEDSVRLTGYVTDQELATLYAHATFLAMPSSYEGFGFPLVEAMSFGVPALTSSISSMPEAGGDAAILADPANVASIADGLLKMMEDDELRTQLASRAKANAARFSWERAAKEMLVVFEEAVRLRQNRR